MSAFVVFRAAVALSRFARTRSLIPKFATPFNGAAVPCDPSIAEGPVLWAFLLFPLPLPPTPTPKAPPPGECEEDGLVLGVTGRSAALPLWEGEEGGTC